MKVKIIILILVFSISLCSCDDKDLPFGAVMDTNESTVSFSHHTGSKQVVVSANRAFGAETTAEWCEAEILTGELNNLKISVSQNDFVGVVRSCEVVLTSPGLEDKKITVVQESINPSFFINRSYIDLKDKYEFSIEVETNFLFKYELPDWIHVSVDNVPETGRKTYSFLADELPAGERYRSDNLVILPVDFRINWSMLIPVSQGEQTGTAEGINKDGPYILEAEDCLEGLESQYMEWWASTGNGLGDNYYVNAYNTTISWLVNVVDPGIYRLAIRQMNWGGGSLKLMIDGVEAASQALLDCGGELDIIYLDNIRLEEGMLNLSMDFSGLSDVDKVTFTYIGN